MIRDVNLSSMFASGKSSIRFTSAASACILPKALSNLVELGTLFSRLFSILICFAFRLQPSENSGTLSAGSRRREIVAPYLVLQDGSPILKRKREPRLAAGLALRPRTTTRALRRHKVTPRGRTASDANGAAVDYSCADIMQILHSIT